MLTEGQTKASSEIRKAPGPREMGLAEVRAVPAPISATERIGGDPVVWLRADELMQAEEEPELMPQMAAKKAPQWLLIE